MKITTVMCKNENSTGFPVNEMGQVFVVGAAQADREWIHIAIDKVAAPEMF